MKLLNLIKNRFFSNSKLSESIKNSEDANSNHSNIFPINEEMAKMTGMDFEFLITGDIDIFEDFDQIMTPNYFKWTKEFRNGWYFYKIDEDEFSYSMEPVGIQMIFNNEITFSKAKKIADEVVGNINATGQNAQLEIINKMKIYRFE